MKTIQQFIFIGIVVCGCHKVKAQLDYNMLYSIHVERNSSLDGTFKAITHTPTYVMIASPLSTGITGLLKKDKSLLQKASFQLIGIGINGILTISLKEIVSRDRPFVTFSEFTALTSAGSKSFPSGHTSSSFNIATSLSLSFPKWYVIAPSVVWASAVGYSRMHLGVHYPSDVLVGALIGSGTAFGSFYLNKWFWKEQKPQKKL